MLNELGELVDVEVELVVVVVIWHGPGTHMLVVRVLESGVPALFSVKTARVYDPAGTLMKQPGVPGVMLQAA
jgi:hypothetical protein